MKQTEYSNHKATFQFRKRPINAKLFQNQKTLKEQFTPNPKKTLGKKYMQESNIFKQRLDEPKKQHRQIVISEQFIKSSKMYRLLKQKMDRCDSMFVKQVNALNEQKLKLKEEIMQAKSQTYQEKVGLWQLKNRLMQLKVLYHEEEEENRRLAEQHFAEYDGEQQGQGEQNQQQMQKSSQVINSQHQQNLQNSQQENQNQMEEGEYKELVEEDRNQFSQILEELMNLKGQSQGISRQLSISSSEEKQQKEQKSSRTKKSEF